MQSITVKDIMVPLSEYATVPIGASLRDAVMVLEEAQKNFKRNPYRHRAVLVVDDEGRIVGKMSQLDLILALEDGYQHIGDLKGVTHGGYRPAFIRSIMEKTRLWERPMAELCRKGAQVKVRDIMYTPDEGEYVSETATIDQAIHQFAVGRHQSLLVTQGNRLVGVLRLPDVFETVYDAIKACDQTDDKAA